MSNKIKNRGDRRKLNYIKSKKDDFKQFKVKDKKITGNCEEAMPIQERKLKKIDYDELYIDNEIPPKDIIEQFFPMDYLTHKE